jgi:hypothetical protein
MSAILSPCAKQQFFTNSGELAAGYRLYITAANTGSPAVTYSDRAATVENSFPIILDARGEATIYLTAGVVYDYTLKTEDDALVWTREDVIANDDTTARSTLRGFGAVGDGVADDSAALQRALDWAKAASGEFWADTGTYLINATPPPSISAAHFRLRGSGVAQTYFKRTVDASGSAMLTLTNCSRAGIYGITFDGTGMAQGHGVLIQGGTIGVIEVLDNQFTNFPGSGLAMIGEAATPGSSCLVQNNLFLSNGVTQTRPQLEAHYINDTKWLDNQFGALDLDGPYPPQGCLLLHCKAGNYERNYHWENLIGGQYDDCDYTRFIGNRWETNERQGAMFYNSALLTLIGNHIHTNSMQASGTYPGISFDTCQHVQFSDNLVFTWDGGVLMDYSLRIAVDCSDFTVAGNRFYGYSLGPVSFSTSSSNLKFTGNYPSGWGLSQSSGSWLAVTSAGNVAAGTTTYLSTAGARALAGEAATPAGRTGNVSKFRIVSTAAPGVGQTYTFTLQKNLVDTGMTFFTTGTGAFSGVVNGSIAFAEGDMIGLKVVTSAGAAASAFNAVIVFDE